LSTLLSSLGNSCFSVRDILEFWWINRSLSMAAFLLGKDTFSPVPVRCFVLDNHTFSEKSFSCFCHSRTPSSSLLIPFPRVPFLRLSPWSRFLPAFIFFIKKGAPSESPRSSELSYTAPRHSSSVSTLLAYPDAPSL